VENMMMRRRAVTMMASTAVIMKSGFKLALGRDGD